MDFGQAVAALDARTNYERSGRLVAPTLDRMRALVDVLAHPERSFPSLHITGTNGKTTVARAATEVLRAAGLRVGTYVSPHVSTIRERFLYDGSPIGEDEFAEAWRELAPFLDLVDAKGSSVTWFEAATALAFMWFADKGVDIGVIEVGMGGTWDATNVIDASVAAITRIGMDHTVLGATPEEIAREKGGIIKEGAVLYTAEQEQGVADVLRARCAEVGAEIRAEGLAFSLERAALALGGQSLSFRIEHDRYTDIFLPMFGEHFARDAIHGAAAARALLGGTALDEELIAEAFANVRVAGRMEVARRQPLVVLDGAHNVPASRALVEALRASFAFDRLWLVVSVMEDKDVRGMLEALVPAAHGVIVTRNNSPRAADPERLAELVRELGGEGQVVQNVADAVSVAIERAQDTDCVCVTGSLYTVGDARSSLIPEVDR